MSAASQLPALRTLLGGMAPREFFARHWQKRPLLVRGAWPGLRDPASVSDLFRLAARADCEARLIVRRGERWTLQHSPLRPGSRRALPARRWTVLVQGLNHFVPAADRMMRRFAFAPYARLDDLMVSYAAPGGGVGPHVDSYDVFLLQGSGRRRWRIALGGDRALDTRAPLKVLARFRPEREWVLEPGDLLYLPPGVAHDGIALEPCFTYSIGFRAPSTRELGADFLVHLQDHLPLPDTRYADPDLAPTRAPGRIDDAFVARCARMLERVRWSRADVVEFLGRRLSEPKPHVRFAPPHRPLAAAGFARAVRRRGAVLAPATGMLYRGRRVFINGESVAAPPGARGALAALADRRALRPGTSITPAGAALLYTWYRAGYLAPVPRGLEAQ
ncbi:MAG: cupin domain-containing protein [Burkholderiales bacterium]